MFQGLQCSSAGNSERFRRFSIFFLASFSLSIIAIPVYGQGNVTVLQTGGGEPLVSDQLQLSTDGLASPMILFDFGFVTDETVTPNTFLDSLTVTLQNASLDTAVLATIDASGVDWAPASPGALSISDSEIQRQPITPPSLTPILGNGVAFSVQMAIPAAFTGSSVTVYFDLFDNLDNSTTAA